MEKATHPIIVIGSSAGGWDTLPILLENLPEDLPASIFIVQHLSSETMGTGFVNHLARRSVLPCAFAVDKEPIVPGRVYLAPPDQHILLTRDRIHTSKGPRENGFRPSVDTLLRSAALHFTTSVIGVILSGMRDDGVEGLTAISRTGGITVVQDPQNTPYPEMPQAALKHLDVDYVVSTNDMGLVLSALVFHPAKAKVAIPKDITDEATIAQRVLTSIDVVEQAGVGSGFTCPSCGGALWDIDHGEFHSFRCHAGHAFGIESLYHLKTKEVEETLWASLRLLEEQKRMLTKFSISDQDPSSISKRLAESQLYTDKPRSMLLKEEGENGQQPF